MVNIEQLAAVWAEGRALAVSLDGMDREALVQIWRAQAVEILSVVVPIIEVEIREEILKELS